MGPAQGGWSHVGWQECVPRTVAAEQGGWQDAGGYTGMQRCGMLLSQHCQYSNVCTDLGEVATCRCMCGCNVGGRGVHVEEKKRWDDRERVAGQDEGVCK